MKSRSLVGLLALVLLFSSSPASAQTPPSKTPTEEQLKAKKELELKALVLLDEIIKDAQSFRVAENRLRLKAMAAGLLWKHDEPRARILFKETLAGVVDLLNNEENAEEVTNPRMFPGATQLRREVVQMLAVHDARMARDFLRSTRRATARPANARHVQPEGDDLQLEYSLGTQITETDPKQALEVAEESLAKGFSYELINTLRTLREKDQEAAAKLAGEIVAKLRNENLTTNQEAANVAFNMLDIVFNSSTENTSKDGKKVEPLLSQQAMRELMDMNITLALNSPGYLSRLNSLEGMMPQVEKYAPARVAELRRKMARNKAMMGSTEVNVEVDESPEWAKYAQLMADGTPDEIIAAAAKAPKDMREHLYQAAASKLADKGELDRAREVIKNNIADSPYRKILLEELEQQDYLTAAEQGKMEQVRKSLEKLKTNEERVLSLSQIATGLAMKGEKKLARQLLDEAHGMVNYRAKNIKQLGAQLMVVQAFARIEPERSLAMLEPIVDQLNELLAAAATLGSFILDEEIMRDDEVRMEIFAGLAPMFSGQYTPDLRALASHDFERTRALADRFQRDEVRMMARLLLVQSILGDQNEMGNVRGRMTTTSPSPVVIEEGAP